VKRLLAALLLLPAFCGAAQFDKEVRDFASRNGQYQLKVGYSGTGGAGRARAVLTGPGGKKLSAFETARPPFSVSIPDDGRRLFFFCGAWGQSVSIFALEIYSQAGEKLASHQLQMTGPAGEDFSADGSVYALGAEQGGGQPEQGRRGVKEGVAGDQQGGRGDAGEQPVAAGFRRAPDVAQEASVLLRGGRSVCPRHGRWAGFRRGRRKAAR